MTDHLERAREEIHRASDRAESEIQENLRSIDEGLQELTEEGGTEAANAAERFEHVEEKLRALIDRTEDETKTAVQDARRTRLVSSAARPGMN